MRRSLMAAALAVAFASPALSQTAQPPLRCAVDGTFAPHAFPTMQGGVEGFQIDSAPFSGVIPAMNAGR